jgi:3,4-dihydroxy-2-butanone 4-phosphate synthase
MNKIVREHYPVANLPEDLREGLEEGATVTVVLEVDTQSFDREKLVDIAIAAKPATWEELMEMRRKLLADGRPSVSAEEAVARIRELRDEWDY